MNDGLFYIGTAFIGVGVLAELIMHTTSIGWRQRKLFAGVALIANAFGSGICLGSEFTVLSVLLGFVTVYRSVNVLRIFQAKMHEQYLIKATKESYWRLAGVQSIILGCWLVVQIKPINLAVNSLVQVVTVILCLACLILLITTIRNLKKTTGKTEPAGGYKLPTVTLAIAARNEDTDLKDCLDKAAASDYPKLEIIVYDDCSQDKTADVIKGFAQHGVRFVQGEKPGDIWLAKNMAYQTLLDQASGEIVMYMGVDARLEVSTISELVDIYKSENLTMMSVLPVRLKSGWVASVIQPMRYWWELAMPKWFLRRPPVLSTCWLIDRKALLNMGGFKSLTRAIIPEEHLAKRVYLQGRYAFVRSNKVIGLTTQKDFINQWLTAVRTRYPQVHKKPEALALRVLLTLVINISPYVLLPLSLIETHLPVLVKILSAISVICLTTSHGLIAAATNPSTKYFALINLPIVTLVDIVAMHVSMVRYEFGEVVWKGRNISIQAMHVFPRLPKI